MKTSLFPTLGVLAALSITAAAQAPAAGQAEEGKKVYMTVCVACHQPTGMGLPPVFPPLAKTEYVSGSPERFAAMILKGNAGPMTINGMTYNQIMPGQEAMLTDDKIAAVMTYVRQNFGNNAPAVAPEVVAAARKKFAGRTAPWTEAELKAWKDDAAAPAAPAAPATPAAQ
ncbi:MAG: cytochrome c [Verrucomicrobiaceae bacterium]|nr:MAG: cytochrome c [Verrucomicrobiaceae bacterium]